MRNAMCRLMSVVILFMFIPFSGGCATKPEIKTTEDVIAISDATIMAVADTAGEAYRSGRITRAEAEQIAVILSRVHEMTGEATALAAAGNHAGARRTLEMARAALLAVERELARRQGDGGKNEVSL